MKDQITSIQVDSIQPGSPPLATVKVAYNQKTYTLENVACVIGPSGFRPAIADILERMEKTIKQA